MAIDFSAMIPPPFALYHADWPATRDATTFTEWLALGIGTACALPLIGAILDWASVGRSGWLLALSLLLPGVVGIIREALSWLLKKLLPVP
jgi:hypothetical protein